VPVDDRGGRCLFRLLPAYYPVPDEISDVCPGFHGFVDTSLVFDGFCVMAGSAVTVRTDPAGLKRTTWGEYLTRFAFGGLITAAAGAIADRWGPEVAGLFLAFPAIFPAGATLLQKHQREKKEKHGMPGNRRGERAAADEAMGTSIGSIGLAAFAVISWLLLPGHSPLLALIAATLGWGMVAVVLWFLRKRRRKFSGWTSGGGERHGLAP
jgi:4-hydroxybenzoate polyprenyltransferase